MKALLFAGVFALALLAGCVDYAAPSPSPLPTVAPVGTPTLSMDAPAESAEQIESELDDLLNDPAFDELDDETLGQLE